MSVKQKLLLAGLVIVIVVYVPVFARSSLLGLPPKLLKHKGFTVLPFNEPGWMVIQRKPYRLVLARRGKVMDESYVIIVSLFSLPQFKRDRAFLKYIKAGLLKDGTAERFRKLKIKVWPYYGKETKCIRFYSKVEDKVPVRQSGKKDPMILEITGFNCRHPNNPKTGIQVSISNRYIPGNPDPSLRMQVEKLFKQTTFTNF